MNDRLQGSIESAWASYTEELATFVPTLRSRESMRIVAESGLDRGDGDAPWVHVQRTDDALESAAVLAGYLYDGVEPAVGNDDLLVQLGWTEPGEHTEHSGLVTRLMTRPASGATEFAERIVRLFREVWAVPHPAFLSSDADTRDKRQFRTATDRRLPDTTAVQPLDIDHLRAIILDTVVDAPGIDVSRETNGDIRIDGFALPVHICFGPDANSVRLHAPLVSGVVMSTALSRRLSWLNTRWRHITFVVAGDQLFADSSVVTQTYVPRHVTSMLYHLGLFVDSVDAAFAAELEGTVYDPTHRHAEPVPTVSWSDDSGTLGTLRAACELTRGPVDAATVEALCRKQDIGELIERAEFSAQRFRDHAHRLGDERRIRAAVMCDAFAVSWTYVADSLSRAFHRPPTPPKPQQISLFDHMEEPALFDL
ncbi:T3SS (YopN, CesT) and YbjN peptide-binding chaperone 1 [Rhodococcoides kyotonense]|uniref:Uncharacterized protein n=1 Tax=Rhodococcoides kyotonense TaxID=398843 RepID=A0A239IHB1_9NOCA|nr:hypothetical protein [Rhodococcus kyotonensis]SNS92812.1 hypothetical protein SAMN05421642_10754 [Rhodococcus kyotonensis]